MAKKIRDALHGYISLTPIEEAFSNHPLMLRLHFIHQNSFTYLTYPCNHNTRYPHSLGTMHVAGELFTSAIRNSAGERIRQFNTDVQLLLSNAGLPLDQIKASVPYD